MNLARRQEDTPSDREQPISTLAPGDRFLASFRAEGWPSWYRYGTLLRVGIGSVTVILDNTGKVFRFTAKRGSKAGKEQEFQASPEPVRWAEETPVIKIGTAELNEYWQTMNKPSWAGSVSASSEKRISAMSASEAVMKALRARYDFANRKLNEAIEAGDDEAIVTTSEKVEAITEEAKSKGVDLTAEVSAPAPAVALVSEAEATVDTTMPQASKTKAQKLKDANDARKQSLASKQANKPATSAAKPKAEKKQRQCLDGCGQMVGSNFAIGHDAKLKSLIHKIERGEGTPSDIPDIAQDLIKFKKGETIREKDSKGNVTNEVQQWICTAAPVRIPGRTEDQTKLTIRQD